MSTSKTLLRSLRRSAPSPFLLSSRSIYTTSPRRAAAKEEWPQAAPLGEYYEACLRNPQPLPFEEKPEEPPNSADPSVLPSGKEPVANESAPSQTQAPTKKKPGRKPKTDDQLKTSSAFPSPSPTIPPPPTNQKTSSQSSPPQPTPPPASAETKARIVFGSRLLSPDDPGYEDRMRLKAEKATVVAGVSIPPMPEEPDNCCMSGCVNCVWETYREEMEEWSSKKQEAETKLEAADTSIRTREMTDGKSTRVSSSSMSDDAGGSEKERQARSTPGTKDSISDDALKHVPPGIRAFMLTEKRLKQKHQRDGTVGG